MMYHWDIGRLVWLRYAVSRLHERLFGYDDGCRESGRWPFRLANWLGLSGYDPSYQGWAKYFVEPE